MDRSRSALVRLLALLTSMRDDRGRFGGCGGVIGVDGEVIGDVPQVDGVEGQVAWPCDTAEGEPRVPADYTGKAALE